MTFDADVTGSGPPLLMLHGWPFHKATFRNLAPLLSDSFECHALNARGMDDRPLARGERLTFESHAKRVLAYFDAQGWPRATILAHDTAGTYARLLAADAPERIERLILLNTEIPGHRPPFIPLYRTLSRLPLYHQSFRMLMRSTRFQRSPQGFGGCFCDLSLIDREFIALFGAHWFETKDRFWRLMRYLQGVDFAVVDALDATHQRIRAPTHFIWGAEDRTFPLDLGRAMAERMPSLSSFTPIGATRFLPHEERPDAVAKAVRGAHAM
ncbi:MAG: alpha/beta hydrolase [Pseudomonadota bacterium]